jgi:hypothetical protein
MDVKKEGEVTRRRRWSSAVVVGLVIVVLSPLVLILLVAYGIYATLLHVLLWLFWGRRVLFVYSDSPVWQSYIEEHLLPALPDGSVVLNWSERRHWKRWSLASAAFRFFGGRREFNPLAVVVRPFHWGRTFRFWRAFRDFKHGKRERLEKIQAEFFASLGRPGA